MKINLEHISPLPKSAIDFLIHTASRETVKKLIVFGSRAIGDYEDFSDLDLAIEAPLLEKIEWLKMKEFLTYDLNSLIKISIVNYSTNPPKLKEQINQKGKIIYEQQS